jgi:hypothetical protein
MLVKYVSIIGSPQTFVFFLFVDIIDITVHDRFWNEINSFSIFSVNFISLPKEVRGIFVIKAAVEMQNNLPCCDC